MSFQAYIDNIKAKTGKTPADFKKLAEKKGFMKDGKLNPSTKATEKAKTKVISPLFISRLKRCSNRTCTSFSSSTTKIFMLLFIGVK